MCTGGGGEREGEREGGIDTSDRGLSTRRLKGKSSNERVELESSSDDYKKEKRRQD